MISRSEIERRYGNIRRAMEEERLEVLVVAGSEYTGFDGAVLYTSGFQIVHRYAYVVIPLQHAPVIVFPGEARYVGEHEATWMEEKVFVDCPGAWFGDTFRARGWKRVGVYGLDYVMTVRDYRALAGGDFEVVPFDAAFDLARAVKSEEEMEGVRESMGINEAGFWEMVRAYRPGRTEAEIMAPPAARFVELGTGRKGMNMLLSGEHGRAWPEFKLPSPTRAVQPDDLILPSLEVAGPSGYWVELSRPLSAGEPADETRSMLQAYQEYAEIAGETLREGSTAEEVHHAVSRPFLERGFKLGHVTGHSIGMTMIELPRIGEGHTTELRENMVFSMHPHAISQDGRACLYMQDTWRVGKERGEPLSQIPTKLFDGTEIPGR